MSNTEEESAYYELIAKLAAGDDTAAAALLEREFSGDSVYSGTNLFVYITDNFDPVKILFQAAYHECRECFEKLRQALVNSASEDGCPPLMLADEIYFVKLESYTNLGDQALAERIASGSVPDLWPVPDDAYSFGIPSRSSSSGVDGLGFSPDIIDFDDMRRGMRLVGNSLEVTLPIEVLTNGMNIESERLNPDEFGDRSRDSRLFTAVFSVEG